MKITIWIQPDKDQDLPRAFQPTGVLTLPLHDNESIEGICGEVTALIAKYKSKTTTPVDSEKRKDLADVIFKRAEQLDEKQSARLCWHLAAMVAHLWRPGPYMRAWLATNTRALRPEANREACAMVVTEAEDAARHVAEFATLEPDKHMAKVCIVMAIYAYGNTTENLEEMLGIIDDVERA